MTLIQILPHVQAALNLTAVCLMTAAYYYIRQQNQAAHRACMIAALVVSTLFLVAYLTYHFNVGNVKFCRPRINPSDLFFHTGESYLIGSVNCTIDFSDARLCP